MGKQHQVLLKRVLVSVLKQLHEINESIMLELPGSEVLPNSPNPEGHYQVGETLHDIPNGNEELE